MVGCMCGPGSPCPRPFPPTCHATSPCPRPFPPTCHATCQPPACRLPARAARYAHFPSLPRPSRAPQPDCSPSCAPPSRRCAKTGSRSTCPASRKRWTRSGWACPTRACQTRRQSGSTQPSRPRGARLGSGWGLPASKGGPGGGGLSCCTCRCTCCASLAGCPACGGANEAAAAHAVRLPAIAA